MTIKATMGLRVDPEEEVDGLDYGEHGMHAYDLHVSGGSDYSPSARVSASAPVRELATEG
jgi:Amt family ammonium transporter